MGSSSSKLEGTKNAISREDDEDLFKELTSCLVGNIFVRAFGEIGFESIHFSEEEGFFVSYDHSNFTGRKMEDGTPWPSRIPLTEVAFDPTQRMLSGTTDFGGVWESEGRGIWEHEKYVSYQFKMVFDTQFTCVLSGTSSYKQANGGTKKRDTFGEDGHYVNAKIHTIYSEETGIRLKEEGASDECLRVIREMSAFPVDYNKRNEVDITKLQELNETYNDESNIFGELTHGYVFATKVLAAKENARYRYEWVDMGRPRLCSYRKYDDNTGMYRSVPIIDPPSQQNTSGISLVEKRAITLRQLRAVFANVARRCRRENWVNEYEGTTTELTENTATLYDINKYVILPFTEDKKISFVSRLPSTAGDQPPRFFASHWWGEPVKDFIACLEQLVRDNAMNTTEKDDRRGGGMTIDTPVWICAYANDQHHLGDDIPVDPRDSGFAKAMKVSRGRTITILDKDGVVFKRIWCVFELDTTLNMADGLWTVYTAHPHTYKDIYGGEEEERDAIGIINGGATVDNGQTYRTTVREREFPSSLIIKSLNIRVEDAEASKEHDRIHILNTIAKRRIEEIDETPLSGHENYATIDNALRATFVSTVAALQSARNSGDGVWSSTLLAMSKGKNPLDMRFGFKDDGWKGTTAEEAVSLIDHLPPTTTSLWISNGNFGVAFVDSVVNHVRTTSKLDGLSLYRTVAGGEDGRKAGVRLAEAVAANTTMTELDLYDTDLLGEENVEEWGAALMENTTLTYLGLDGVGDDVEDKLREATKSRTPQLNIR